MDALTVSAAVAAATGFVLLALGVREVAERRRERSASSYLEQVLDTTPADGDDDLHDPLARPFLDRIVRPALRRVAGAVSSVTPTDHRLRIQDAIVHAGLEGTVRPDEVLVAEVAGTALGLGLGAGLAASGLLAPVPAILCAALLVAAGAIGPMTWLRRRRDQRSEGIRRELPETLDLLSISVEAGLGLEGAIEVVVDEGHGPLAHELDRTLQEMELGVARRDALANLRSRTQVAELSAFVQALVQADVLGMPLARVLKTQAEEMRTKRRQWAREKAGKLPVKILFPLVVCIFPAVLVVILGPAMTQIGQAF